MLNATFFYRIRKVTTEKIQFKMSGWLLKIYFVKLVKKHMFEKVITPRIWGLMSKGSACSQNKLLVGYLQYHRHR